MEGGEGGKGTFHSNEQAPAGNSFEIAFATSKASLTVRVNNKCTALKLEQMDTVAGNNNWVLYLDTIPGFGGESKENPPPKK